MSLSKKLYKLLDSKSLMKYIIKCGTDLIHNTRIKTKINNKDFLNRVFHPSELTQSRKLTSIFALKEAVFKALEISSNHWLDIEIKYRKNGKPAVVLSKSLSPKNLVYIDCSVSHDADLTIAIVVFLLEDK